MGGKEGNGATQERREKTYYPTDPDAQATLRTLVFDAGFDAWLHTTGITLNVADQWERFGRYALAHGKSYADWRHAFMNWLTSPYQAQPPAQKTMHQRQEALRQWAEKGMQESQHGS